VADIAAACGVSKALLYHYYRDKEHLLHDIAESYVERLQRIVDEVRSESLPPAARMRRLIARFMQEYEHSATRHRVLVQDVKYLSKAHRARVVARQRAVVDGFAQVVEELSPAASAAALRKPLTMILFGMMNWTFTWFSERGPLRYADLAPIVADLFIGGLGRLRGLPSGGPSPSARRPRARPVMKAMA
jgi:AcrR family transcriptional regulator